MKSVSAVVINHSLVGCQFVLTFIALILVDFDWSKNEFKQTKVQWDQLSKSR